MNKVVLIGRLTKDPEIRYTQGDEPVAIGRYTLAVDRKSKGKDGNREADFISCIAFRKAADFAEKYLHQGMKVAVVGRIQTGSYTSRDGHKVYTTDVVVEEHEFCEKIAEGQPEEAPSPDAYGFMSIPDSTDDEGLPFN